ncbi:hypothetical protein FDZ71_08420 [bacterium]|nr:MAG: hypothetical protein FDZ71_08420 [bacterium]
MKCHKFGENYSKHTRHDDRLLLACADCHKKTEVEIEQDDNVHSVSYFLIHKRTCYDKDYAKACVGCHSLWSKDKAKEKLIGFKGREMVHD